MNLVRLSLLIGAAVLLSSKTQAQDDAQARSDDLLTAYEAHVFDGEKNVRLPYRLLKPADYDPQQKYPLVLFLHGAGERGDDNAKQLVHGGRNFADDSLRRRYPAFILFPQCPAEKKWVEVPWDAAAHKAPEDPGDVMRAVFALVESLQKEHPIDADRIYGVGLSMGGYGTWDILQRNPGLLAAAVPVCGGGDPAKIEGCKATPIWAFHGDMDQAVPVGRSREMVKALQAAGGQPIYTEYAGVGHDSWTGAFDNRLVWDWLFAQKKSHPQDAD